MKYHSESPPPKYFKTPSLDALLEFARGLNKWWKIEPAPMGWQIYGHLDGDINIPEWHYINEAPKFAVYALIAKLKEVERGDK